MSSKYGSEVLAIQQIRQRSPDTPARTLARRILNRGFDSFELRALAVNAIAGGRTFFSIYSVIRRYDKQLAAA